MYSVIIVAGGTGSRMKRDTPKQLELLNHKPVIVYSIEKFLAFNAKTQIIVVMHPDYCRTFIDIQNYFKMNEITLVNGGETRFHSVKNGLEKVNTSSEIIAIHDAARPLVSLNTIKNTFADAGKFGAAIPVIEINESLREIGPQNSKAVDRKNYRIVQTPQCFKKEIVENAYKQSYDEKFTDDATVVETAGNKIHLTEGNIENIKITYPLDLLLASALLK
jgi:2-C-methyl-D-erythritol 4-phosphate cytidylyltransferase